VASLVGQDLSQKNENFVLSSTLEQMPDVTYCPRESCKAAVLLEGNKFEKQLGQCPACYFAFCPRCQRSFHGIEPCSLLEGLYVVSTFFSLTNPSVFPIDYRFEDRKRKKKVSELGGDIGDIK
jgi:hypothetical protein